jgi:hypothetical protein
MEVYACPDVRQSLQCYMQELGINQQRPLELDCLLAAAGQVAARLALNKNN